MSPDRELLKHTQALRHLARDLVGESDADDLLQETALQALTRPPQRPGPFGGWLASVLRHLASKHRRAAAIRQRHEQAAARPERVAPSREVEDCDAFRRLSEAVVALPEPYRGTLLARYLRDESPMAIARRTGVPVRTVKTRLQRGLALLRARFDGEGDDWRAGFAGVFGIGGVAAGVGAGVAVMATGTKLAIGGGAVVLAVAIAWFISTPRRQTPPPSKTPIASMPAASTTLAPLPRTELAPADTLPAVQLLDAVTQAPLPDAWLANTTVLQADQRGVVSDRSLRAGNTYVAGCAGHLRARVALQAGAQTVRLDPSILVQGSIRFPADAQLPEARSLRLTVSGRNVLDDGFVTKKVPVDGNYCFQFDSGDGKHLEVELFTGNLQPLGSVAWDYPQRILVVPAKAVAPTPTATPGPMRTVTVIFTPGFLANWQARAAVVDPGARYIDLTGDRSGADAEAPRSARAGHLLGVGHARARAGGLQDSSAVFQLAMASGTWDFAWHDAAQGTVYRWQRVAVGDEDRAIQLSMPPLGTLQISFLGVEAKDVSLRERPVLALLQTMDGQRVAATYAADGTAVAMAPNLPAGNYYLVGHGSDRTHRFLRTPPIAVQIAADQTTFVDVPLQSASVVRVTAGPEPAAGSITSLDGVVLGNFDLAAWKGWSEVLAPGSYLLRVRADGGWTAGRRFAVDGVTTVELGLQ